MKKILILMLAMVLTISMMSVNVFASDTSSENSVQAPKEVHITYDEYIKILADEKGLSIDEAKEFDQKENEKFQKKLAKQFPELKNKKFDVDGKILGVTTSSDGYYYTTLEWPFTYSGNSNFKAAITATFKLYNYGSFRQICSVLGLSSRRVAGLYSCTWNQSYVWQDPSNDAMPVTSVNLGAVGYFEFKITESGGVTMGVPGFEFTGSIGNEHIYQSSSMSMQATYSLY